MLAPIAVALAVGFIGWAYQALKPPPPNLCGSPGGPPVTSPRIKLSDGRHVAYRETGVPKEEANHKIIIIHGFSSSKDLNLPVPQELIEELKIYFLFFDRPGYGESDPDPLRSVKSEACDVEQIADKLQIGSKFYVMGISMGAYLVYGCLKYIPNRLLGASLVVPFVHYWWPGLPANLSREALKRLPAGDQWTFRIAHYTPWLINWWMSQKWFPSLSMMTGNMAIFSPSDMEMLKKLSESPSDGQEKILQQGVHESLNRDLMTGYAKWEFDPMDLSNPFPDNEGSVHIWQGCEDRVIPSQINQFISEKLPWIQYHEVPDAAMFAAALVLSLGVLVYTYKSIKPPPPKICGKPNGPPVESPRIRLSDGRHLAYRERGVAKENAKYKVILVHGFDFSKDIYLSLTQDNMDKLGVYTF